MSLGGKVERSRPGEKGGLVASGSRAPGCLQQLRTFYSMAGLRWSQWTSARSRQAWVGWLCCAVPGQVFNIIIAFALPHFLPKDVRYRQIIPCTVLIGPLMMLHGRAINEVFQDTTGGYRAFLQVNGLRAHIYWLETWSYHLALSAGFAVWFTVLARLVPVFMKHTNSVLVFVAFTLAIQHHSLIGCFYGRFFLRSIEHANAGGLITTLLNFVGISSCVWCVSASRMQWLQIIPTFGVNNMLASIQCLEADKVGFTFDTFFRSTCMSSPRCIGGEIVPPGVTMLNILWVNLILACLIYWLDQVVAPRDWGVARHPLFFLSGFQSCFGEHAAKKRGDSYGTGRPPALRLHDVHKVYPADDGGKGHAALTNFNLEVHSGELFALLGHNGSGKTTMINIAVGLIAPTAGDGTVNGISVSEDTAEAQRQLALCPQQTKVFEDITVETNLEFFCTVRGMDRSMVGQQVFEVLRAVGLEKERHRLCSELSGGQSRRLWLAAALLGSRPLILLDEPSSGLDPASRRRLWGTLEWVRGLGSAVIFTTHYLDEADIAADRKAILSHGRVRAVGTSLELKQKYAVGYRLGLDLLAGSTASASWSALQELVLRHIPKATQERKKREAVDGGADEAKAASFLLPFSDVDSIGPLLEEIDTRKQELGVREYDVQMSSLEDVYMKLAPSFSGTVDEEESLPTVVEETTSAQPASGLAFSSALDLESPKPACQDYPPPEIFRQMLSLFAVRLAVVTDGGALTYVFLRIVLPVISISTLLTRSIIMMSPAAWFHMATTFPMMLLAVLGPSVGQLNADATSKRKLMMLTHRMSPLAYTLGGFLADYVLLLPVILALPLLALISRTVYLSGPGLLLIFFTAVTYPVHLSVWVNYLQSFVKHNKSSQTNDFLLISSGVLFSALVPSVIVMVLITQGLDNWPYKAHLLRKVPLVSGAFSLALPTYSMPGVLILVLYQSFGAYYEENYHTCYKMPCEISLSPWHFFTTQAAMPFYLAMVPTAMRARRLLLAAQSAALSQGDGAGEGTPPPEERDLPPKDEGVLEEEERLRRGGHDDIIAYRGLHYTYVAEESDAKVRAVRGVSLGLRHGECFGLLGPNGAGKTTTLACLTGELWPPTAGTVFFNGQDLSEVGFQSLYGKLGMCLQHDGHLWDCLSGLSHLYFYGRLKGIPEDLLEVEVDSTLERVRLKVKDAARPVKEYSGGMKRRLSIAVALLGKPSVLFMDEPTAAVDVMVKRELWKVIKNRGAGKMVLLTSHQMEEVEMLCDRVAIQVLGRLRALGTVSHLRRRYGSGYQLELVSEAKPKGVVGEDADQDSADRVQELERFVRGRVHPSAKLLDSQVGRAVFQLEESEESGPVRLATVFKQVSAARAELGIKDYGVRQPTLEQVFVRFAQEQAEAEEAERARMGMPP